MWWNIHTFQFNVKPYYCNGISEREVLRHAIIWTYYLPWFVTARSWVYHDVAWYMTQGIRGSYSMTLILRAVSVVDPSSPAHIFCHTAHIYRQQISSFTDCWTQHVLNYVKNIVMLLVHIQLHRSWRYMSMLHLHAHHFCSNIRHTWPFVAYTTVQYYNMTVKILTGNCINFSIAAGLIMLHMPVVK